jgi:hypothetical protein
LAAGLLGVAWGAHVLAWASETHALVQSELRSAEAARADRAALSRVTGEVVSADQLRKWDEAAVRRLVAEDIKARAGRAWN